jgi:uncharacterized cupin superfamily protein
VDVGHVRLGVRLREPGVLFPQLGINLRVLEPGQPSNLYHSENQQEAFLVLSGECRLLVEGEERLLRPWDFFHSPAGTEHILVGAGDGPCVILDGRRTVARGTTALPGVGACGALRGERGGGDVRLRAGIRAVRAIAVGASLVLGPASLGLATLLESLAGLYSFDVEVLAGGPRRRSHAQVPAGTPRNAQECRPSNRPAPRASSSPSNPRSTLASSRTADRRASQRSRLRGCGSPCGCGDTSPMPRPTSQFRS